MKPHFEPTFTRRDFLAKSGAGFGALALGYLLGQERASAAGVLSPLAAKPPQFPAHAKNVIFLFMEGGPSHLDTFDPKPELQRLAGKTIPPSFGEVMTSMGEFYSPILPDKRVWKQHGQGGLWISDWLPHIAECADDLAVIRSCRGEGLNHSSGICLMNSGATLGGRPSLGSWVTYGLGSENTDLPAFVVMQDSNARVINGPRNWSSGFMPALYQGTRVSGGSEPIANLNTPEGVTAGEQRGKLDLLDRMNHQFAGQHPEQTELEARIASYELAFRMQAEAPGTVDMAKESDATKKLYGIDEKETDVFGRQCLLARRLVERGVRFVQLYHGAGGKWDAHAHIEKNHSALCKAMDKPVAGLLRDLKSRGLLDSTLVIWGGEFGRTPASEKGDGRDHNPYGFTMWMAGGGVKGGQVIGSTDDIGLRAGENPMHVHDIHATVLWLMGLDNMNLVYKYKGRPERPTVNEGEPYKKIVG